MDGFTKRTKRAMPQHRPIKKARAAQTASHSKPLASRKPQTLALPKRQKKWVGYLQLAIITILGLIAGLFLQIIPIGYVIVGTYIVAAFIKRIPSRITFLIALAVLTLSPVGIAIGQAAVANGFSLFGFLLLTVGVVTLVIELIKERRYPLMD